MSASLPTEVYIPILKYAAQRDAGVAHMLAYVSKNVCALTREDRWRTIVLRTQKQLQSLLALLHDLAAAAAEHEENVHCISIPSAYPTKVTRSLFIDTSEDGEERDLVSNIKLMSRPDSEAHEGLLRWFPHVDVLALGAAESHVFAWESVQPHSMMLVYDGDDKLFRDKFWLATHDQLSELHPMRKRLHTLHVVGVNYENALAGLPMPLHWLAPLCEGSFEDGSFVQMTTMKDALPNAVSGLRFLRYDTRKFSFRPTDIFAQRLRPFCQALYVRRGLRPEDEERCQRWLTGSGIDPHLELELCWSSEYAHADDRLRQTASMYTGGWPHELRGAWTERDRHDKAQESFGAELQESMTELYGWDAPHGAMRGMLVDRIERGFSRADEYHRECAERFLARHVDLDTDESLPIELAFRVRPPASFLQLGKHHAALSVSARIAAFMELGRRDST